MAKELKIKIYHQTLTRKKISGLFIHCLWKYEMAQLFWRSPEISFKKIQTKKINKKYKPCSAMQLVHCILRHLFQRNENLFSHKNLKMNGHSSFIQNNPNQEEPQMSFNGWKIRQSMIYPHSGIQPGIRKEQSINTQPPSTSRELHSAKGPTPTDCAVLFHFHLQNTLKEKG